MKSILHKLSTLILLLYLTPQLTSAQIDYYDDFTGSDIIWTQLEFHTTDVAVCGNGAAFRANPVNTVGTMVPVESVSQSLGVATGEEIVLTYNYKLLEYDEVLPYKPLNLAAWGMFTVEYGPTRNGPWTPIDMVTDKNHTISTECITREVSFIPNEGEEIYLRLYADAALNKEISYYVYIEDVSLLERNLTVDPIYAEAYIEVQPNPVTDYATVVYDGQIDKLELFNMQGQEVEIIDLDNDFKRLDMSGLSFGEYVLHVTSGGTVKTINIKKN